MTTTRKKSAFCFTEKKKGIRVDKKNHRLLSSHCVRGARCTTRGDWCHARVNTSRRAFCLGTKMVKVRFLVFLFVSFRSREALCRAERDVVVPFRLRLRDEKGTTKDAKRRAPRRGATRREKVDREATRRKRAYFSTTFFRARRKGNDETRAWHTRSETSRRFWVGIPGVSGPLVSGADLFLLSLSLSPSSSRSSKTHRLGKPKSRSRRRRKSRNTRATSSACGPSSPAYSARCCPSRCKCAGINTGPYRKNLSANLNTAIRRI